MYPLQVNYKTNSGFAFCKAYFLRQILKLNFLAFIFEQGLRLGKHGAFVRQDRAFRFVQIKVRQ